MARTELRWSNQIKDKSVTKIKLVDDFLGGVDWNITNGANNATITGLKDPAAARDAVNKQYVDGLVDSTMKNPDSHNASTNAYPTLYMGRGIQAGDTWYITWAGTMGTNKANVGDLLVAKTDGATTDANFFLVESNRDQATETVLGVSKIATQTLVNAGVNDTDYVTPLKLKTILGTLTKTTQYTNESKTVTNWSAVLNALSNLGTHATLKVIDVCVYLNGIRQTPWAGNDYTIDQATGIITFTFNLVTGDAVIVDYKSQNA